MARVSQQQQHQGDQDRCRDASYKPRVIAILVVYRRGLGSGLVGWAVGLQAQLEYRMHVGAELWLYGKRRRNSSKQVHRKVPGRTKYMDGHPHASLDFWILLLLCSGLDDGGPGDRYIYARPSSDPS